MLNGIQKKYGIFGIFSVQVRPQQQNDERPVVLKLLAQQAHGLADPVIDRLRRHAERGGDLLVGLAFEPVHAESLLEFGRHLAQRGRETFHQFAFKVKIGIVEPSS